MVQFSTSVIYGTGDEITIHALAQNEDMQERFLLCRAVVLLPQKAMQEVKESILDIWEFYNEEEVPMLADRSEVTVGPGQLVGITDRPPLELESEQ